MGGLTRMKPKKGGPEFEKMYREDMAASKELGGPELKPIREGGMTMGDIFSYSFGPKQQIDKLRDEKKVADLNKSIASNQRKITQSASKTAASMRARRGAYSLMTSQDIVSRQDKLG